MSDMSKLDRRSFLRLAGASTAAMAAAGAALALADEKPAEGAPEGAPEGEGGPQGGPGGGPGGPGGNSGPVDRTAAKEQAKADGRVFGYSGPGDWLGEAPVIDDADIIETIDADVVVIGSGHSGVQAGLAAAEGGAKTVVCEAMDQEVFSWYGEDMGCFNSKFVMDAGFGEWDLGAITDEFITRGGGRAYPDIVRSYVQNSGAVLDHMVEVAAEMGVDPKAYTYDDTPEGWVIIQANMDYDKVMAGDDIYDCLNYTNYPLHPGTKTWVGSVQFMGPYNDEPIQGVAANSVLPLVQQACIDKAVSLGADWRFGSNVTVIVKDDEGKVTGVITKEADGYRKINAAKGVIICAGDYAGNAEICWATLNEMMERYEREGGLKDDFYSFMGGRNGSGVKLGCWAGGFIEPAPRGCMNLGGGIGGPWGTNAMLWLNTAGKRFCNEGNLTEVQTACWRQPKGSGWLVTDNKWLKSVCACGIEHSGPNAGRPQYYQDMIDGMNAIEPGPEPGKVNQCTIAERGYASVYKADTLEELLSYMGMAEDVIPTAIESINHYNELCANGKDTDYGKDASVMIPVDEPPFYGVVGNLGQRSTTPMMVSMSGLMTDENQNVLDEDYQPIAGLYAAGNSLGGRYGTGYSTPCAGNSIGMACTHGALAGKLVASL